MSRRSETYNGTFEDVRRIVQRTGASGYWKDRGNHKIFLSDDGASIGWWCTTKTIVFQGDPVSARRLREEFITQAVRHIRQRNGLPQHL